MLHCADSVVVFGLRRDAEVELFVDGVSAGCRPVEGESEVFLLPTPLRDMPPSPTVQAYQYLGTETAVSPVIVAEDPASLPGGMPEPTMYERVHQCQTSLVVLHLPGANLRVEHSGTPSHTWTPRSQGNHTRFSTQGHSLQAGETLTASQRFCGGPWKDSRTITVLSAPLPLPPVTFYAPMFGDQPSIVLESIVQGAGFTLEETVVPVTVASSNSHPYVFAPIDLHRWPLGSPLGKIGSHSFDATQTLCGEKSPPASPPPAAPCTSLPAPEIAPPQAGDRVVIVTESVPGATVFLRDGGMLPLGSGFGPRIMLNRALASGDAVIATQSLPGCEGTKGFWVPVLGPGDPE